MNTVKKNYPVQGLGCAACVARVETILRNCKGVSSASVSLASRMAQVEFDANVTSSTELRQAVQNGGYDLLVDESAQAEQKAQELQAQEYSKLKRDCIVAVITAVTMMPLSMFIGTFPAKGWILAILAAYSVFVCGRRFVVTAFRQALHATASMDTLVALSTIISFAFSLFNLLWPSVWTSRGLEANLYFDSCSMIIAFILIGRTLESRARANTTASIKALAGLQKTNSVIYPGDTITVRPGQRIPADGTVTDGSSYVDESMLTGEPIAVPKEKGSKVYAGTVNTKGSFTFTANKVGSDTMLSSIIRMVRNAQGSKAAIQKKVDKVAGVFVPIIMCISILTLIAWIFLSDDGVTMGLLSMVTVLVIACPCSLGLATPTALIAGIGAGARKGILIKDADALEIASAIDTVILDKTGTITEGRPSVRESLWFDENAKPVLLAMERLSEHPLSEAVCESLTNVSPVKISNFRSITGQGIAASYDGKEYFAVNYLPDGISDSQSLAWKQDGMTVIYFHDGTSLLSVMGISDKIKESSIQAVKALSDMGIQVHMLTGDNAQAAGKVALAAGIEKVHAQALPGDKLDIVARLQSEGHKVAMAGDGINDSAALAKADLSIAMGKGSDIAISTAMVTIVSSDLARIPQMVSLSARTERIIRQNLFWAFFYNTLAVPVAAGLLYPICGFMINPMVAAACMAMSSVCVVTNSLRLTK